MPTYCIEMLCGPGRRNPAIKLTRASDAEAVSTCGASIAAEPPTGARHGVR